MVGVGSPPSAIVLVPNHMHAHCVRILFIVRVARGCVVAEEFWPPSTGGYYRRDHGTTQPIREKKNWSNPSKQVPGWVRTKLFDPKQKKSDPSWKLRIKMRANPIQPKSDPTRSDQIKGRAWANIFWLETWSDPTERMIRSTRRECINSCSHLLSCKHVFK